MPPAAIDYAMPLRRHFAAIIAADIAMPLFAIAR